MRRARLLVFSMAVILLGTGFVFAQENKDSGSSENKTPVIKGFQAEAIGLITFAEGRYVQLAEAVPQEKYSWRPGEGVRSFAEVLTHMIQANYGLPNFVGVQPPADAPKDLGKMTDKKEIIAMLKKSFEHTRNAVKGMSDEDLEKATNFFGNDTTYRGVLSFMNAHTNQHLGQLIAYSRVNGIVPPWSQTDGGGN